MTTYTTQMDAARKGNRNSADQNRCRKRTYAG